MGMRKKTGFILMIIGLIVIVAGVLMK